MNSAALDICDCRFPLDYAYRFRIPANVKKTLILPSTEKVFIYLHRGTEQITYESRHVLSTDTTYLTYGINVLCTCQGIPPNLVLAVLDPFGITEISTKIRNCRFFIIHPLANHPQVYMLNPLSLFSYSLLSLYQNQLENFITQNHPTLPASIHKSKLRIHPISFNFRECHHNHSYPIETCKNPEHTEKI